MPPLPPLKWQDAIFKVQSISLNSYFFSKPIFLSIAMWQVLGGVVLVFSFHRKPGLCSSTEIRMFTATQPRPSKAPHETFRSLHKHCWATQSLTLGSHLNSSWNCLSSKLRNTERQEMASTSQDLASYGGKQGVSSQPVEYYHTADDTGVIEEENWTKGTIAMLYLSKTLSPCSANVGLPHL